MDILLLDKRTQSLVTDYVPTEEMLFDLVKFFSIFSDVTRLKMLSALAISEMCVSDISAVLKINQTTVSHQLKLLKDNGAVTSRREGKIIYYSISDDVINECMLNGVNFIKQINI